MDFGTHRYVNAILCIRNLAHAHTHTHMPASQPLSCEIDAKTLSLVDSIKIHAIFEIDIHRYNKRAHIISSGIVHIRIRMFKSFKMMYLPRMRFAYIDKTMEDKYVIGIGYYGRKYAIMLMHCIRAIDTAY